MNHRFLAPLLGGILAGAPSPRSLPPLPNALSNRYQASAGTLRNGVLTVSLVARMTNWHPLADDGPAIPVEGFGEEGKEPIVPGPLIRAPLGTRIELGVRNTLPDTLFFGAGCGYPCRTPDTLRVAPGATGHLSLQPKAPGTFVYWSSPIEKGQFVGIGRGGQLGGVMVVDSGAVVPDRIFVITTFESGADSAKPGSRDRLIMAINGKAWPYTERVSYAVGDSVHWRVIHLGGGEHPMHLHGFYFRVTSHGDGGTDKPIAPSDQPFGVTEEVGTLSTMAIAWQPDRPGNWLFHCHKPMHTAAGRSDAWETEAQVPHHDDAHHAETGMGGLVMGITVRPATGAPVAGVAAPTVNRLRLLVHRHDHYYGAEPAYGFVRQEGDKEPARDSVLVPGPLLTLTRGVPTEITVVNQADTMTAVHWHGIELESFYDGVAGWSGAGTRMAPVIAPGDSFIARMTPPRAGTFIYHTHVNDMRQMAAGLYGGLVVLEPGQKWSDITDHLFAIGQAGLDVPAWTIVNGVPTSGTERWRKGVTHRLRFLSMTIDQESDIVIEKATGVAEWTPVARDGRPLPASLVVAGPAKLHIGPGQTYDFEWKPEPGVYRMRVSAVTNVLLTIAVR